MPYENPTVPLLFNLDRSSLIDTQYKVAETQCELIYMSFKIGKS